MSTRCSVTFSPILEETEEHVHLQLEGCSSPVPSSMTSSQATPPSTRSSISPSSSTSTMSSRRSTTSLEASEDARGVLYELKIQSQPGVSKLHAGLQGVHQLLDKAYKQRIRAVHLHSSDQLLVDLISNLQVHLRSEFAHFNPIVVTSDVQKLLRDISVLTLMVKINIEYVPEPEGILRRVSLRIKSAFSMLRRFA